MNQDELSIKAQNVLRRIGGLAGLEAYVQSGKLLVSLGGVGQKTVKELNEYLRSNKLKNQPDFDSNYIDLTNLNISSLSVKSQKTISKLGGVSGLKNYLKSGKSLLELNGIGNKTLEEIQKYILKNEKDLEVEETNTSDNNFKELYDLKNFSSLIDLYEKIKKESSDQIIKYLNELEREFNYINGEKQKGLYLKKYFFNDFIFQRKVSIHGGNYELLKEIFLMLNSFIHKMYEDESCMPLVEYLIENRKSNENKKLPIDLELSILYHNQNEQIDFYEFVLNQILTNLKNTKYDRIKFDLISKELKILENNEGNFQYSINDIRLAKSNLDIEVKNIIKLTTKYKEIAERICFPYIPNGFLFEFPLVNEIKFENKKIQLSTYFLKLIFQNLLHETHCPLTPLLSKSQNSKKVFKELDENTFLSKEFVHETNFEDLIDFLSINIYEFENVSFDYNLEILIKRFYIENNLEISETNIQNLRLLIEKIKTVKVPINKRLIQRMQLDEIESSSVIIIESELKTVGKPMSTKEIILVLELNGIIKNRIEVLKILHAYRTIFVMLGYGIWGLKEWEDKFKYSGTIRDIVCQILNESETPLYLNSIHSIINDHREISINSLISNLKLSEGIFLFFNCKFIGLKNKKYDQNWYNLPQIHSSKISKITKSFNYSKELKLEILTKQGIPIEHAKFLIDN